jgi:hypothetical protein
MPGRRSLLSVAREDMGFYLCKAATARGEHFLKTKEPGEVPEDTWKVVRILEIRFSEHRSFSTSKKKTALTAHIVKCIRIAGSVRDCYDVILRILSDESAAGVVRIDKIGNARNLGAYIEASFPGWWATAPGGGLKSDFYNAFC